MECINYCFCFSKHHQWYGAFLLKKYFDKRNDQIKKGKAKAKENVLFKSIDAIGKRHMQIQ